MPKLTIFIIIIFLVIFGISRIDNTYHYEKQEKSDFDILLDEVFEKGQDDYQISKVLKK